MNRAVDGDSLPEDAGRRENRCSPRPNLLLAATIEADGLKAPVRIRNLSERGALVEGPALPGVGARVMLRRQEVEIAGRVVWAAAPRCGIEFDGHVSVPEWISGRKSGDIFGQARVDTIQAAIRAGAAVPAPPASEEIGSALAQLDDRLAEELICLRRLLETTGDALIDEPIVVERHAALLQNFDLAAQILGHVAKILAADDRAAAVDAIGMNELRARLTRRAAPGG
ncbi:MAG: PilZ domain-containing protein [Sphingosinicella sp.]|uniref:PilZ domain-containing protein n=1 Tax=Sphingosinicella sp. TaxID=1917971 RepID=UPI004037F28B